MIGLPVVHRDEHALRVRQRRQPGERGDDEGETS